MSTPNSCTSYCHIPFFHPTQYRVGNFVSVLLVSVGQPPKRAKTRVVRRSASCSYSPAPRVARTLHKTPATRTWRWTVNRGICPSFSCNVCHHDETPTSTSPSNLSIKVNGPRPCAQFRADAVGAMRMGPQTEVRHQPHTTPHRRTDRKEAGGLRSSVASLRSPPQQCCRYAARTDGWGRLASKSMSQRTSTIIYLFGICLDLLHSPSRHHTLVASPWMSR